MPKPTRIRKTHHVGIEGYHWFVEYEFIPGKWAALSVPLATEQDAIAASKLLTLEFIGCARPLHCARPLPNRCDKHGVVWGDGEHEGCGLCADAHLADMPLHSKEWLKRWFEAMLSRVTVWMPTIGAERLGARMDGPRPRAADDVDEIYPMMLRLRLTRLRKCFQKAGLPSKDCWCIGGGQGGGTLPCSSASDGE